jgi:hypothetical protein
MPSVKVGHFGHGNNGYFRYMKLSNVLRWGMKRLEPEFPTSTTVATLKPLLARYQGL